MPWSSEPLSGNHVRLEPLAPEHIGALWDVAQHESIWRYMPFEAEQFEGFERYLTQLMAQRDRSESFPFATIDRASGDCIGSTAFLALNPANRRLEIGATWITPDHQRSAINTEAKLLMLTDAFERLGCIRVELKTDALNERSRQAIARLGAQEEGTFRNHMIMPTGRVRDTVWFSITDREWPPIKDRLRARLGDAA